MTGSTSEDDGSGSAGLLAPISGLLAIVLAVMAGASRSYALSGSSTYLVVPAVLAAASVGCIYLKRRLQAAPTDGDGDGHRDD
jgi:hypothetical protein